MDRRDFLKKMFLGIIGGGVYLMSPKLKPVFVEAQGEGIVIFPEKDCLVHLNETAVYVYKKLQEGYKAEEIAKMMTDEYDVTEEKALEDVKNFIMELKQRGLIDEKTV